MHTPQWDQVARLYDTLTSLGLKRVEGEGVAIYRTQTHIIVQVDPNHGDVKTPPAEVPAPAEPKRREPPKAASGKAAPKRPAPKPAPARAGK